MESTIERSSLHHCVNLGLSACLCEIIPHHTLSFSDSILISIQSKTGVNSITTDTLLTQLPLDSKLWP